MTGTETISVTPEIGYGNFKTVHDILRSISEQRIVPVEIPLVNNYIDGNWNEAVLHKMLRSGADREGSLVAINLGMEKARGKIAVAMDADTIIAPQSISLMVRHFSDEKVVALQPKKPRQATLPMDLRNLLQCLRQHRNALFNQRSRALGLIAMPQMWLFQYVFLPLSPITDVYLVMALLGKSPLKSMAFYALFLALDLLASLYTFKLEKEDPEPLLWFLVQRVIYRQFMAYVVLRSMLTALKGSISAGTS